MPQDPRPQVSVDPEAQKKIDAAKKILNRSQHIVDGLKNNEAWDMVLEDIKSERQRLDDTWHLLTDEKKWYEFRVTKMAVMKIINMISDYESDMKLAASEIDKVKHSADQIPHDVDNE